MDRELLLTAVKNNASIISDVSKDLLDEEIIIEAIRQDPVIVLSIPFEIRNNKEIMMKALEIDEFVFNGLTDELQTDIDIVMQLVKHHGLARKLISEKFTINREIMKASYQKGWKFIQECIHSLAVQQDGTV